jgi:hypothetical protein
VIAHPRIQGGYTVVNRLLPDPTKLTAFLTDFPALANEVSTGGATPLHMCGMSRRNQVAVSTLVSFGAKLEAVDTYGYTPLQRMASNNLADGARALLEAGADPMGTGRMGEVPAQVARLNGSYEPRDALEGMPPGFAAVCRRERWNEQDTWQRLNGGATWYEAENGSYLYFNRADRRFWLDTPDGAGVYVTAAVAMGEQPPRRPPSVGWRILDGYAPSSSPAQQLPSVHMYPLA